MFCYPKFLHIKVFASKLWIYLYLQVAAPISYAAPALSYAAPALSYSAPALSYAAPAITKVAAPVAYATPALAKVATPAYGLSTAYGLGGLGYLH
jgi:hypothetical protein